MPTDLSTLGSGCSPIGLSIIIPVYNEEATLRTTLEKVLALSITELEVIVVDDGSTDRTAAIITDVARRDQRIRRIRLRQNVGKTAAVRKGIELSQGRILIIQDADLEYDPIEIADLIRPILDGTADVVYGSRLLGRPSRGSWPLGHYWGNRVITMLSNCFTSWRLTDVETCYKAFRAPVLKEMAINSRRFGMEIEVTALASRTSARFLELSISYTPRSVSRGKKIRFRDGLWAIFYIVRYNVFASAPELRRYVEMVNNELETGCCSATYGRSSESLTPISSSIRGTDHT